MKRSAIFSFILHIGLLVILLVGIPMPTKQVPVNEHPIIMEFEKIGPVSKAPVLTPDASKEEKKALKKPKPKPEEKKPEPPKEEPKKEEPKKEEPKPEEKKPVEEPKKDDAEPIPEPKKEKQKEPEPKKEPKKDVKKDIKKDPKKDTKKEDKKAPIKAEVNLNAKKPKPLASEKKKSVDDIVDSLIDDSLTDDEGAEKGAPAMEIGKDITATDIDAIRQKIYKCWLVPIGAQNVKELIVDVTMEIAKDGNVTKATIVNKDRMSDPYFQAAAESAQRAVLDPACNPLPLPADKYEKWKKLTLRFNPKDMY